MHLKGFRINKPFFITSHEDNRKTKNPRKSKLEDIISNSLDRLRRFTGKFSIANVQLGKRTSLRALQIAVQMSGFAMRSSQRDFLFLTKLTQKSNKSSRLFVCRKRQIEIPCFTIGFCKNVSLDIVRLNLQMF